MISKNRRIPSLICFGLLFALSSVAADLAYLTPATTPDGLTLLPAPPERMSAEDQADSDEGFSVYTQRTPDQVALAKAENRLTVFHFSPVIGAWFQPGKFPKTEALFKQLEAEIKPSTDQLKGHFKRLRPYNAEPKRFTDTIEHDVMTNYSYPSGHSTRGTLYALVLAKLFPEQREALIAKGREAGWLRIQGGVHYPLDVYAGRVWGQALAKAIFENPDFKKDLAEAKAELDAAHK